jgi:hypothetical protein
MNTKERSNRLLHITLSLLRREKRLLVFPFVSAALFFIIWGFFLVPLFLQPTGHSLLTDAHWGAVMKRIAALSSTGAQTADVSKLFWLAAVATHFALMLAVIFCQVAFFHEIKQALAGEPVRVKRGLRFAASRWRAIVAWSLFTGLIGWLISEIESRVSWVGKFISVGIGLTWSTVSAFVIPAMVCDTKENNPIILLRVSSGALRRTWGEWIVGLIPLEVAISTVLFVISGCGAVILFAGMSYACFAFNLPFWIIVPVVGMCLLPLLMPVFFVTTVVTGIYRCAMFIYATEGVIPDAFDQELLDSGWQVK